MSYAEKIVFDYIEGKTTGEDNKIRAAIGQLTAETNRDLMVAINRLTDQIPITISDLRTTISSNTQEIIKSNERLSRSNEDHAKLMGWLTFGLVITGLANFALQVLIIWFKK